jgi:hypothetical protein
MTHLKHVSPVTESSTACLVFMHGLNGHPKTTWMASADEDSFWPAWIAELYPDLAVISVGYEASAIAWLGPTMPIFYHAMNLLDLMKANGLLNIPLIFIAHSLGGLIVKEMIHIADTYNNEAWQAISRRTLAVVFLATPHRGSHVASRVSSLVSYLGALGKLLRPAVIVRDLEANAASLGALNLWYTNNARRLSIRTFVYFEEELTGGVHVVDAASADPGIEGVFPIPLPSNHIAISKPKSRNDDIFIRLNCLINELVMSVVKIEIEHIEENRSIYGCVKGLPRVAIQSLRVIVYVCAPFTNRWHIHPFTDGGEGRCWATIESTGSWRIDTVRRSVGVPLWEYTSDGIAALVVRRDYSPPSETYDVRSVEHLALVTRLLPNTPDYGKV